MRNNVMPLLMLCLVFSAKTQVFALDKDKLNVGIMPGVAVPVGSFKDDFKSSLALGIAGEYSLKDDLRLGLEIGNSFKHKLKQNNDFYVKVISVSPVIKKLWNKDKFTYYAAAGLGIYHWSTPSFLTLPSDSGNELGYNVGVGASYMLDNGLSAGLDVRWHSFNDGDGDINTVIIGLKLDYRFK